MRNNKIIKSAFTLAEVMITLTIIGVVAAIAIPSVIANVQQQEYKTGLKKAISVLNSSITMNTTLENETPYDNGDLFNYLQRHMSVIKTVDCNFKMNESNTSGESITNAAFYTADGMRFEITGSNWTHNENLKLHENGEAIPIRQECAQIGYCGSYGLANNPNSTSRMPCLVTVDVNGEKKPSIYANNITEGAYIYPKPDDKKITDVFNILITETKAIPFGVSAQRAMYQGKNKP